MVPLAVALRVLRLPPPPLWPPPPLFDLGRVGRPLPPPLALSAGGGSCFPLWGGRRSAGRPPPLRLSLLWLPLAVAAAVLSLPAVAAKVVLSVPATAAKAKTAVVSVLRGRGVLSVRVLAVGVLLLLVRGGVRGVLPRRRGLLPLLVLPPPLQGGRGPWWFVVGVGVGVDLGVWGRLSLGGLPVVLQHRRLPPLLGVPPPPLSPPPRRNAPTCRRRSGRRAPPPTSRGCVRGRGRRSPSRLFMSRG